MSTDVILISKADRDADARLIAGLRQQVIRLTAERDALLAQARPGYRVVQHPTRPVFLEPAAIQDGHWDDEEED